jgi:methylmalonyl-CoA mutase
VIVPPARSRYLAEMADTVRGYHRRVAPRAGWRASASNCARRACCRARPRRTKPRATRWPANATLAWRGERKLLAMWPQMQAAYAATSTW